MSSVLPAKHLLSQIEESIASGSPYVAYPYSYPHKTAYRRLDPIRPLRQVWKEEKKDALFLYIHVPFCEMRCGFCNLFTTANPHKEVAQQYIRKLALQARVVRESLGNDQIHIARMAVGGGTPTFLPPAELAKLFEFTHGLFGVQPAAIPMSVETSPRTAELDRLQVLKDFGVDRISIGVQSFVDSEVAAASRAQKSVWVDTALRRIRNLAFPILNLDLIYGLPGQTIASWLESLKMAAQWKPEEMFLYPLYVRPLTGLERKGCSAEDKLRLECYRVACDFLFAEGYEQISMRMFQRKSNSSPLSASAAHYCCQQDGMVGLGCGARSYTQTLHYSTDFAVGSTGVREIISDYLHRGDIQFAHADYGCELNLDERKRRWLIKSLFRTAGLDRHAYLQEFDNDVLDDFPQLAYLTESGYFLLSNSALMPTAAGLERSDSIGPMLFSNHVKSQMEEFDFR